MTQPTNRRTFGSVFKNPEHELGAGKIAILATLDRAAAAPDHPGVA